MDNLVSLILEKGITFVIASVAVWMLAKLFKEEYQRQKEIIAGYERNAKDHMNGISASNSKLVLAIENAKEDISTLRLDIEAAVTSNTELKLQLAKEMLGLKVHSAQIHERSEKINKSIEEVMGKVILIENKQVVHHQVLEILSKKLKS